MSGLFDCDCACAAPPDYKPVADASKEAAEIMANLGREQLAESRRQYDQNTAFINPIVEAQRDIMRQSMAQAADYYDYLKKFRPLEQEMLSEVSNREAKKAIEQKERDKILSMSDINNQEMQDARDRDILTMARNKLYDLDRANIDEQIATAIADQRSGYTQALGQIARQGMRYGLTPAAIASQASPMMLQQASAIAAAANAARNAGIDSYLQRIGLDRSLRQADFGKNLGLKQTLRNMKLQDDALSWARALDVTGMARGLPGASSGAYSVANQAGTNAAANYMAPGNALMSGMAQGVNTIGQGQQLQLQGLGNVLNAQTSFANSQNQMYANMSGGSGLGGLLGFAGSMMAAPSGSFAANLLSKIPIG